MPARPPIVVTTDSPVPSSEPSAGESFDVSTLLGSLAERRKKIQEANYIDLHVPRWDEPGMASIYVRYRPVNFDKVNKDVERLRKMGEKSPLVVSAAIALVDCCIGVFGYIPDRDSPDDPDKAQRVSLRPNDPYGPWTKFDTELADVLGVKTTSARETCQALYVTDGDLLAASDALSRFSAKAADEVDDAFLGR